MRGNQLLPKVEPFPTTEVVPYETRYISGWQVEHYQVALPAAAFGVLFWRRGFATALIADVTALAAIALLA